VAALGVPGTGLAASTPVVLWGFSQGGHAAAHAAQMAPTETPALDLRAVAVAAPVSDVTHFAQRAERRSDQLGVLVTVVAGFVAAYPELQPTTVLTADAWADAGLLEEACIGEVVAAYDRPVPAVVAAPVTADAALQARLADNQAGSSPVGVPVLVVQGTADDIVDPADTTALVGRWCRLGVAVDHVERPDAPHGVPVDDLVVPWLADRLRGEAAAGSCETRAAPGP
jgi:pimeloyl-ACP methyl ester carboxylesterase